MQKFIHDSVIKVKLGLALQSSLKLQTTITACNAFVIRSRGGHSRRIIGSWPREMHGYMLYPPTPQCPRREQYALQPILFFLPDLCYLSAYPSVFPNGVLPCPTCRTAAAVTSNGFTAGRRVVGINSTYVLIGRSYKCDTCQTLCRPHTFLFLCWDEETKFETELGSYFKRHRLVYRLRGMGAGLEQFYYVDGTRSRAPC